jgi:hypothetical protein
MASLLLRFVEFLVEGKTFFFPPIDCDYTAFSLRTNVEARVVFYAFFSLLQIESLAN